MSKNQSPAAGDRRARQDIAKASWNASCTNSQTGDQKQDRPIFRLTLRPEPHVVDPVYALRGLLKRALRSYGLRAIDVSVVEEARYDADDDINKSVQEGFAAIRARKAAGGPGWGES